MDGCFGAVSVNSIQRQFLASPGQSTPLKLIVPRIQYDNNNNMILEVKLDSIGEFKSNKSNQTLQTFMIYLAVFGESFQE